MNILSILFFIHFSIKIFILFKSCLSEIIGSLTYPSLIGTLYFVTACQSAPIRVETTSGTFHITTACNVFSTSSSIRSR
jgi:hypothetical protein